MQETARWVVFVAKYLEKLELEKCKVVVAGPGELGHLIGNSRQALALCLSHRCNGSSQRWWASSDDCWTFTEMLMTEEMFSIWQFSLRIGRQGRHKGLAYTTAWNEGFQDLVEDLWNYAPFDPSGLGSHVLEARMARDVLTLSGLSKPGLVGSVSTRQPPEQATMQVWWWSLSKYWWSWSHA